MGKFSVRRGLVEAEDTMQARWVGEQFIRHALKKVVLKLLIYTCSRDRRSFRRIRAWRPRHTGSKVSHGFWYASILCFQAQDWKDSVQSHDVIHTGMKLVDL